MPRVRTKPRVIRVEVDEQPFTPPRVEHPVTKDELIRYYYEEEMSVADIASFLGRGKTTIRRWMEKYELPRRTYSDATILHYKKLKDKK